LKPEIPCSRALRGIVFTLALAACAERAANEPETAVARTSALCDAYGFRRATDAYRQCVVEVEKAQWRQARSRSRVNCTPMGERLVCQ